MIIILIILILLILLYIMPLKYKISYNLKNRNNQLEIYFKTLYGLINYKIDLANLINRFDDKAERKYGTGLKGIKDSKDIINNKNELNINKYKKSIINSKVTYVKYKNIIRYFINNVLIKEMKFNIEYDLEDAAITGIITGILYSIRSNILFWISNYKKVDNYMFDINPLFMQENIIHINFSCIIQLKLGHIIYGTIRSLILYKRR